jgi:tetratricopeptide (TPR) repeat protein
MDKTVALQALNRIFNHIGSPQSVIKLIRKKKLRNCRNNQEKFSYCLNIFHSYVRLGKWNAANYWINKAQKFKVKNNAKQVENKIIWEYEYAKFLLGLGQVNISIKMFQKLIKLKWPQKLNWYRFTINTLIIENYPNEIIKNRSQANFLIKKTEKYIHNHVHLKVVLDRTKAIFFLNTKNYKKALFFFKRSLEDIEPVADYNGKMVLIREMAKTYKELKKYDKSIKLLKKGRKFLIENLIVNKIREVEFLEQIAFVLKLMRNTGANRYFKKAYNGYLKIGANLRAKQFFEKYNMIT